MRCHCGVELFGHWGAGTPAPATPLGHVEAWMLLLQLHTLLSLCEECVKKSRGKTLFAAGRRGRALRRCHVQARWRQSMIWPFWRHPTLGVAGVQAGQPE